MKKKPDPFMIDEDDDFEWTEQDFKDARPIEEVMPGFADAMARLAAKKMGRPKKDNPKTPLSIRVDSDLVDVLRAEVPRYQTRINALIRDAIEKHSEILFGEKV